MTMDIEVLDAIDRAPNSSPSGAVGRRRCNSGQSGEPHADEFRRDSRLARSGSEGESDEWNAEGAFLPALFPASEKPREPGLLHICYCLVVPPPLALVAYAASVPVGVEPPSTHSTPQTLGARHRSAQPGGRRDGAGSAAAGIIRNGHRTGKTASLDDRAIRRLSWLFRIMPAAAEPAPSRRPPGWALRCRAPSVWGVECVLGGSTPTGTDAA